MADARPSALAGPRADPKQFEHFYVMASPAYGKRSSWVDIDSTPHQRKGIPTHYDFRSQIAVQFLESRHRIDRISHHRILALLGRAHGSGKDLARVHSYTQGK